MLDIVHHPPVWDGVSHKDRNLDEPVLLPVRYLRVGQNELRVAFTDSEQHAMVVQMLQPATLDEVRADVVRDG